MMIAAWTCFFIDYFDKEKGDENPKKKKIKKSKKKELDVYDDEKQDQLKQTDDENLLQQSNSEPILLVWFRIILKYIQLNLYYRNQAQPMIGIQNDTYGLHIPNGDTTQLPYLNNVEKSVSMHNLSVQSNSTNTSSSNATGGSAGSKNFRKKLLNKQLKTLANQNDIINLAQADQEQDDNSYYQENINEFSNLQNDDRYLTPVQIQNGSYSSQQQQFRPKYNEATV